ncbi:homeobox domain-containing protein [Marssonina coronariae]|uniref:Homeobox domain-containing protein n=1 Tax=Diplocarpon coronariae TaxID=2795749 RepID=A0A218ZCF9_9HELO|nr:homeobox domain-containing protein [Marssonina coronariae]
MGACADRNPADRGDPAHCKPASALAQAWAGRGMELSQPRYISQTPWASSPPREASNMPALTLRQPPAHHLPGPTALLDGKFTDPPFVPRSECRPRSESTQVHSSPMQLPPIREMVDFSARPEPERRREVSPTSNGKRRRLLDDDEDDEARARYSPRQRSPGPLGDRPPSTSTVDPARRSSVAYSASDNWSARSSPYQSAQGLPPLQTPNLPGRHEMRPQAPTLPPLSTLASPMSFPAANFSEYSLAGPRASPYAYPPVPRAAFELPPHQSTFSYGYQQPRGQSYSGPSSFTMGHDRSPFSAHHAYPGSLNPYGSEGLEREGDPRQRKRHQISNWFINARRRQLPTMINNARAESDARMARSGELCAQAPSHDFGEESDRRSEESQYDEEFDARPRSVLAGPKTRDSI